MQPLLPVIRALLRASLSLGENFVTLWKIVGTLWLPFYLCAVGTGLSMMAMLTHHMKR